MTRVPQFRDRIEAFIAEVVGVVNGMMIRSRNRYEAALRQAATATLDHGSEGYKGAARARRGFDRILASVGWP
jgi:hypothetical protein